MINNENTNSLNFGFSEISTEDEKRNSLVSIPNQNTRFLYNSFTNSSNLDLFKNRATKTSKGKAEYLVNESNTAILQKTKDTEITLDLGGKISRPTKNIALYVFHKLGLQNITTNLFDDLFIEFPLTDLVDVGMYKESKYARAGFNKAKDELTSIKLKALVRVGKDKDLSKVTDSDTTVMFIKGGIARGTCYIVLNKYINWSNFALQTFALIPKTYWSLTANSQDLFYNIFSRARQETKGHKDKEISFNIGFRYIQEIMNLPEETATKNPKRDIIEPILKAIEECQTREDAQKENFILESFYDKNGNIKTFLDGYLTVTLKSFYAEKIIEISNNRERFIQQEQAKKERITEQAKIKALASRSKWNNSKGLGITEQAKIKALASKEKKESK